MVNPLRRSLKINHSKLLSDSVRKALLLNPLPVIKNKAWQDQTNHEIKRIMNIYLKGWIKHVENKENNK